jgi:glycogen synthase
MKILLLASSYRPHIGGLQTTVEALAKEMSGNGHTVQVVTNRNPRTLPSREVLEDVSVIRLQFLLPRWFYFRQERPDLFLAGIWFFPVTLIRLLIVVFRFKPDVVNLHYLGSPALFLWFVRRLHPCRMIVSLHGGDVVREPARSRFDHWLFRTIVLNADSVTVCSDFLAERVRELLPGVEIPLTVIRNGVNVETFSSAPPFDHGRPFMFGVGQLEFHKGFDLLVEAFAELANDVPEWDLLVGGTGSRGSDLAKLVHQRGLEARVRFLGRLEESAVASLMRGSSVIVIPSRNEAFGIVALEARCSGSSIVATMVGGLAEALHGYPVRWVAGANVPDLVRAIRQEIEAPLRKDTQAHANNREFLREFTWSHITQEYLNLYAIRR